MARTKVIRLCLSLAAIPALIALCALTIPQAEADSPAAPSPARPASGLVLTSTNPISVSAFSIEQSIWSGEPVQDPSLAVGPDGVVHFMWWTETEHYNNPCTGVAGDAAYYAFFNPNTGEVKVGSPMLEVQSPQIRAGRDNTLFATWLKCTEATQRYHPMFDWAPADLWRNPLDGTNPFTYTVGAISPFDTNDYDDDPPSLFAAQEGNRSRPHVVWERYDSSLPDAPHLLYYARPLTDTLPITTTRTPDPRLQTTTIPIGDYTGSHPSITVFDRRVNTEAHVIWEREITLGCPLHEIDWGYAPSLPPTLTAAQPGSPPMWQPPMTISGNAWNKRQAKAPVSCDAYTRTAEFPAVATGPQDSLVAVWNEWTMGSPEYQVMATHLVRTDAGAPSWSTPVTVTTATNSMTVPPATVVDRLGRQYVLWNDKFEKILLKASDPDTSWQTPPIQLNRGPWCAGSSSGPEHRVSKLDLVYDQAHDKLHAIWLARTPTAGSSPNRLCYASVDLAPHKTFLPYVGKLTTQWLGTPHTTGIQPLARP